MNQNIYYRHPDWLGSSRFTSDSNRNMYSDSAYGPFGDVYAQAGTADPSFTGMDQDTSTNLYDFPAREYGIQGRWPSPDPAGIASVDPTDPQTWNRYAYVRNSPLTVTDPSGADYEIDCSQGYDIQAPMGFCGATFGGDTLDDLNSALGIWNMTASENNDSGTISSNVHSTVMADYQWVPGAAIEITTSQCATCTPSPDGGSPLIEIDPGQPGTPSGQGDTSSGGGSTVANCNPTQDDTCYMNKVLGLAGAEASHDMNCIGDALAGEIPFVGHLTKNPGTKVDKISGPLAEATELQIVASQSDRIGPAVDYIELPNISELLTKYGPNAEELLSKLAPAAALIGGVAAGAQAMKCFEAH